MAQATDYDLANQSGASFRAELNTILAAIASANSGATEPTTTYAFMFWADTSSGLLKVRNAANNAWVSIGTLASTNLGLMPLSGGILTGAINEFQGADIASAGTINLTTATGNYVHVTGTTTITTVTLAQGYERTVVFDGALTLTNGASLLLPTAANITTAAGDVAVFRGEAASVVRCVVYQRKNGTALSAAAPSGAITASGYTVSTDRLLGRDTAGTGAIEEISLGTGLSLSAGVLSSTASGMTLGTPVNTTSGTAHDWVIPSGVKEVNVNFYRVSLNAIAAIGVRIGTGGSPDTTGYLSNSSAISSTANTTTATSGTTTGFLSTISPAANSTMSGTLTLRLLDSSTNTWVASGNFMYDSSAGTIVTIVGDKSLSGTLDIVRIYGGTFDNGKANVSYI